MIELRRGIDVIYEQQHLLFGVILHRKDDDGYLEVHVVQCYCSAICTDKGMSHPRNKRIKESSTFGVCLGRLNGRAR